MLLAQLLLPWLKDLRKTRERPAHLTLVSSGMHMSVNNANWPALAEKSGGILRHFSAKENFRGGQALYPVSKLMLQYALAELARMALDPASGRPDVIVNSCCPGMVRTEISRNLKEKSLLIRLAEPLVTTLLAQTPEVGARTYLAAGLATESENVSFPFRFPPIILLKVDRTDMRYLDIFVRC